MEAIKKFIGPGIGVFIVLFAVITYFMAGRDGEIFMSTYGITLAYILSGLAIAGILFGAALALIADPKSAITALAGIVGLAVLFGISWALTSPQESTRVSLGTSHFVGAILNMTYILLFLASLGILFHFVQRLVQGLSK